MSGMGAVWQVAKREMKERGRSKAYLLTSLFTILIVVGIVVIPTFFEGGTSEYEVGSVGEGNAEIVDAAIQIGNAGDIEGEDPSVAMEVIEYDSRQEGEIALAEDEVDILLVDATEIVTDAAGAGGLGGNSLSNLLQRGAATLELERLVAEEGNAAAEVVELMTTDTLEVTSLDGEDPVDESQVFVAYAGLMLLYVAILLYGTWILTGVTEEKTNRVVEVLLSALRPWQLLGGKIVGIGMLGLTQLAITLLMAALAINFTGVLDLPEIPIANLAGIILWFVLGFLLYAVLFAAAGSLVSRMEDAQTAAMPMTMLAVAGMFVSIAALENPEGIVARIGTFFPLTAPMVVPVRTALNGIAAWEYILAVVITVASIGLMLWIAGRVYAGGLLQFGGKVKVKDAWQSASR